MCILGEIKLPGVLVEARAVEPKAFEVADAPEDGGGGAADDGGAAVGDAAVGARRGRARSAGPRVDTELGRGAALFIYKGRGISQGGTQGLRGSVVIRQIDLPDPTRRSRRSKDRG